MDIFLFIIVIMTKMQDIFQLSLNFNSVERMCLNRLLLRQQL